MTDFLHQQRGMSVQGATALMFVFGFGCFTGNLAGGILGQVFTFSFCAPYFSRPMRISTWTYLADLS
jgi:predicted MFS family arabinose efflux permease